MCGKGCAKYARNSLVFRSVQIFLPHIILYDVCCLSLIVVTRDVRTSATCVSGIVAQCCYLRFLLLLYFPALRVARFWRLAIAIYTTANGTTIRTKVQQMMRALFVAILFLRNS